MHLEDTCLGASCAGHMETSLLANLNHVYNYVYVCIKVLRVYNKYTCYLANARTLNNTRRCVRSELDVVQENMRVELTSELN